MLVHYFEFFSKKFTVLKASQTTVVLPLSAGVNLIKLFGVNLLTLFCKLHLFIAMQKYFLRL
jgi:hypothetical protein